LGPAKKLEIRKINVVIGLHVVMRHLKRLSKDLL